MTAAPGFLTGFRGAGAIYVVVHGPRRTAVWDA